MKRYPQEFPLWGSELRIHLQCRGTGVIPGPAEWLKYPVLTQLWGRLQLQLGFEPWPGTSRCHGCSQKKEKRKRHPQIREGSNPQKPVNFQSLLLPSLLPPSLPFLPMRLLREDFQNEKQQPRGVLMGASHEEEITSRDPRPAGVVCVARSHT